MRNSFTDVKKKMVSRYLSKDTDQVSSKSTNINILLNRVKLDQKKESRKKIMFTAATSIGLLVFGVLIF